MSNISGADWPERSSYSDDAEVVDAYIQRLFALCDKLRLADDDARKLMLTNLASAAGLGLTVLGALEIVGAQPPETVCRLLRVSKPEYLPHSYADVLHAAKVFLLSEAEFQVGKGLRSVLRSLDPGCRPARWADVVRELLLKSAARTDDRAADALMVPVLLSRAMHANGIHHNADPYDRIFSISGVDYEFRDGEPVRHDTWAHIIHALTAALRVVDDILSAESVRRIEHLPDTDRDHTRQHSA